MKELGGHDFMLSFSRKYSNKKASRIFVIFHHNVNGIFVFLTWTFRLWAKIHIDCHQKAPKKTFIVHPKAKWSELKKHKRLKKKKKKNMQGTFKSTLTITYHSPLPFCQRCTITKDIFVNSTNKYK